MIFLHSISTLLSAPDKQQNTKNSNLITSFIFDIFHCAKSAGIPHKKGAHRIRNIPFHFDGNSPGLILRFLRSGCFASLFLYAPPSLHHQSAADVDRTQNHQQIANTIQQLQGRHGSNGRGNMLIILSIAASRWWGLWPPIAIFVSVLTSSWRPWCARAWHCELNGKC